MGLFLGFSFLSIAECIYYAVVRPWRSVREYQNLYKADNRSSRISLSLKRTKTRRSILKKRNRKCLLSPKLLNEHRKLFEKTNIRLAMDWMRLRKMSSAIIIADKLDLIIYLALQYFKI